MKAFVPVVLSACVLTGCTGIEPAAIGAGFTAVQTGVTYISGSNSYSYQPAVFADVYVAAIRAGDRLALELYTDRVISKAGHEIRYNFGENKEHRIVVTVTPSTDAVTRVVVNSKKTSTRGMSTLYLEVLTDELVSMGAYSPLLDLELLPDPN